jgi:hypothetical protein
MEEKKKDRELYSSVNPSPDGGKEEGYRMIELSKSLSLWGKRKRIQSDRG